MLERRPRREFESLTDSLRRLSIELREVPVRRDPNACLLLEAVHGVRIRSIGSKRERTLTDEPEGISEVVNRDPKYLSCSSELMGSDASLAILDVAYGLPTRESEPISKALLREALLFP